jgi:hypothetical protein
MAVKAVIFYCTTFSPLPPYFPLYDPEKSAKRCAREEMGERKRKRNRKSLLSLLSLPGDPRRSYLTISRQ